MQDAEGRTFTFNGDDKQVQVKDVDQNVIGTYYYDGEGKRVKKVTNTETTVFVYDGGGDLAAEYSTAVNPQPTTSYLTTDHLGSPRVITDKVGNVISRRDFMPFGEEIYAGTGPRTTVQKYSATGTDNILKRFTGYEKDIETGLDFAEARMYQNRHGRFTAPDPLLASANAANPQTFNRYTYTGNNPINYTDPSGLNWCQQNGGTSVNFQAGRTTCNNGWNQVDDQYRKAISDFSSVSNNGPAPGGTIIRFNSDGTVSVANPNNARDAVGIAQATGTEVQATQTEIVTTTAAEVSSTITPRPTLGLLSLPCLGVDSACGSGNVPLPSLSPGTDAAQVLLMTQIALDVADGSEIPIASQAASLLNIAIDAANGDSVSVAAGVASLIPGAG